MQLKPFSSVYKELDVHRTTAQRWCQCFLGIKGERGIPVYLNEDECHLLWQISMYKKIGYSDYQIKNFINSSNFDKNTELTNTIAKLEKEKNDIEEKLVIAKAFKETGLDPYVLKFKMKEYKDFTFSQLISFIKLSKIDVENQDKILEKYYETIFNDSFISSLVDTTIKLENLYKSNYHYASIETQMIINDLFNITSSLFSDSTYLFSHICLILSPNGDVAKEIDEEIGQGFSMYIIEAISVYCENNTKKADKELFSSLKKLEKLFKSNIPFDLIEVQSEVAKVHDFFQGFEFLPTDFRDELLKHYSKPSSKSALKEMFSDAEDINFIDQFSKAIDYFYSTKVTEHK